MLGNVGTDEPPLKRMLSFLMTGRFCSDMCAPVLWICGGLYSSMEVKMLACGLGSAVPLLPSSARAALRPLTRLSTWLVRFD